MKKYREIQQKLCNNDNQHQKQQIKGCQQPQVSVKSPEISQFLDEYNNWFYDLLHLNQKQYLILSQSQIKDLKKQRIEFNINNFKQTSLKINFISKNKAFMKMKFELGYFTLQLLIINRPMQKAFYNQHNQNIQFGGNFGKIELIKMYKQRQQQHTQQVTANINNEQNQYYAEQQNQYQQVQFISKVIGFQKTLNPLTQVSSYCYSQLLPSITQYSLLKICSILQCSVCLLPSQLFKFDLICYKDGIQFFMEKGESIEQYLRKENIFQIQIQIKRQLQLMHQLRIVHNDIKINNVIYSKRYDKVVFIDFGLTQIMLKQCGIKKCTKFKGSYHYVSNQMKMLIYKKYGYVDLFWNDVCCAIKTIEIIFDISQNKLADHFQTQNQLQISNQIQLQSTITKNPNLRFTQCGNIQAVKFSNTQVVKKQNLNTLFNTIIFRSYNLLFYIMQKAFYTFYQFSQKYDKQAYLFKSLIDLYPQFKYMNLMIPVLEDYKDQYQASIIYQNHFQDYYQFVNNSIHRKKAFSIFFQFSHKLYLEYYYFDHKCHQKLIFQDQIRKRYTSQNILFHQQQQIIRDKFYQQFLIVQKIIIQKYYSTQQCQDSFIDFSLLVKQHDIKEEIKQQFIHLFIVTLISMRENPEKCIKLVVRFIRRFKNSINQLIQHLYDVNNIQISHFRRNSINLKQKLKNYLNNSLQTQNLIEPIYVIQTVDNYEVILKFSQQNQFDLNYQRLQSSIQKQLCYIINKYLLQQCFNDKYSNVQQHKLITYLKLWKVLQEQDSCFQTYNSKQIMVFLFIYNFHQLKELAQTLECNKMILKYYSQQKREILYYHNYLLLITTIDRHTYLNYSQFLLQTSDFFKQPQYLCNQHLRFIHQCQRQIKYFGSYYSYQSQLDYLNKKIKEKLCMPQDRMKDLIQDYDQKNMTYFKGKKNDNSQMFFFYVMIKFTVNLHQMLQNYQQQYDLMNRHKSFFFIFTGQDQLNRGLENTQLCYQLLGIKQKALPLQNDINQNQSSGPLFQNQSSGPLFYINQQKTNMKFDQILRYCSKFDNAQYYRLNVNGCHDQRIFQIRLFNQLLRNFDKLFDFQICYKIMLAIKKLYQQSYQQKNLQQPDEQSFILLDFILTTITFNIKSKISNQLFYYFFQKYEQAVFIMLDFNPNRYPTLYWINKYQYDIKRSLNYYTNLSIGKLLNNLIKYTKVQSKMCLNFLIKTIINKYQNENIPAKYQNVQINKYAKITIQAIKKSNKTFWYFRQLDLSSSLFYIFYTHKQFQNFTFIISQMVNFMQKIGGEINTKAFQDVSINFQQFKPKLFQVRQILECLKLHQLKSFYNQPNIAIFVVTCLRVIITQDQSIFSSTQIQKLLKKVQICLRKLNRFHIKSLSSRFNRLVALYLKKCQNYVKYHYLNNKCLRKQFNDNLQSIQSCYNSLKWNRQRSFLLRLFQPFQLNFSIKLNKLDLINLKN